MCNKRNSRKVTIKGRTFRVDSCIAKEVKELNNKGIKTLGCCCGHFRYKKTIIIESNGVIKELYSGIIIPRIRRYYLIDKEGYYYIPELNKKYI